MPICFGFRPLLVGFFGVGQGSSLRRFWEDMLQQTRDSACHCCLIVKYLSQLHKQFISPIPLVQFNWYCERGGDNDEALTWTKDLINLFFPKDVYRRSLFFFLALPARSHELADVFEKNEKKNKPRSVYGLTHLMLFRELATSKFIC